MLLFFVIGCCPSCCFVDFVVVGVALVRVVVAVCCWRQVNDRWLLAVAIVVGGVFVGSCCCFVVVVVVVGPLL